MTVRALAMCLFNAGYTIKDVSDFSTEACRDLNRIFLEIEADYIDSLSVQEKEDLKK